MFVNGHGSSGGYQITNSVRLRASAPGYLSRSNNVTPTNAQKWTWSGWIKKAWMAANTSIISGGATVNDYQLIWMNTSDQIGTIHNIGGATQDNLTSTQVFRDPSAWGHLVIVYDSANATAGNRMLIYWNGVAVSLPGTPVPLNCTGHINGNPSSLTQYIGQRGYSSLPLDGYLAEVRMVDGQVLTPSSFGQQDANGVWVPKSYTGTYGANGYYLDFKDASGANTLGLDRSGNGNNWTCNGISISAGVTYDSMVDTPTNNYATLNGITGSASGAISYAGLRFTSDVANSQTKLGSIAVSSGKWYWEMTWGAGTLGVEIGISPATRGIDANGYYPGSDASSYSYDRNGSKYNNGSGTAYGAVYAAGDTVAAALDLDAGTITFYKNGASQGQAFSGLSGAFVPALACYGVSNYYDANFGQRPFTYTPPTGFKALCTANLPAVAIPKPAAYFDAKTRTGTGAAFNVTGEGFAPDFLWSKSRSAATDHILSDRVRGTTKYLVSDSTAAEVTDAQAVTAFNSDGFSGGTMAALNTNAATYIDWMWKANGAGVSNTDGSITSTVSANQTAGFSIVKIAAGTAANATVGHGLGKVLSLIIAKAFSQTTEWPVYHGSLANTEYLVLNTTAAKATGATYWNSTTPTSGVFSLGSSTNTNNTNGMLFYCFAEIAGFSKFGSYTGNGSADGPFVYCGFRPKYVLIKNSSISSNWYVWDTARGVYNASTPELYPNLSNAEGGSGDLDITANGFKLRNSADAGINGSTNTIIFAAFAEHPFGGSNVPPSPAR